MGRPGPKPFLTDAIMAELVLEITNTESAKGKPWNIRALYDYCLEVGYWKEVQFSYDGFRKAIQRRRDENRLGGLKFRKPSLHGVKELDPAVVDKRYSFCKERLADAEDPDFLFVFWDLSFKVDSPTGDDYTVREGKFRLCITCPVITFVWGPIGECPCCL